MKARKGLAQLGFRMGGSAVTVSVGCCSRQPRKESESWNPANSSIGRAESKKRPVVSLMERTENGSRVRSFHVERVTILNIKPIGSRKAVLCSDLCCYHRNAYWQRTEIRYS